MKTVKLIAGLMILFLIGCTSSRITHTWTKENVPVKKYNKILVFALNSETNIDNRQKMEDHMVGDLKDLGYSAVSSLQAFGPKAFRTMNEESVIDKLQNSGFDAVITIVLLDKERERYYVPGRVYYSPYGIYQRRFWGYYTTMYDRIYSPGYYTTSTRYFWESNLYDMTSKELLYSAQTESFDPSSAESLGHEYGKIIIKNMVDKKVLAKQDIPVLN